MTVETTVSLTEEQEAYARRLVEQGRYPNVSAVVEDGLRKLRAELEPMDKALEGALRPRAKGAFVVVRQPTAEAYGLERSEELPKDIGRIGAYAVSNSMSWIAASDESVHETAGTDRMAEVEATMQLLRANQGGPRGWIVPNLRCVKLDRTLIYFTVDDARRMVQVLLMLPS